MALGFLFPSLLFLFVSLSTLLSVSPSTAGCPFVSFSVASVLSVTYAHPPPLSSSRFSPLLFHFFPPLHLHHLCLPGSTAIYAKSETLGFDVFGHPSSFHCEGGALDQGGGRNRVVNAEQF